MIKLHRVVKMSWLQIYVWCYFSETHWNRNGSNIFNCPQVTFKALICRLKLQTIKIYQKWLFAAFWRKHYFIVTQLWFQLLITRQLLIVRSFHNMIRLFVYNVCIKSHIMIRFFECNILCNEWIDRLKDTPDPRNIWCCH